MSVALLLVGGAVMAPDPACLADGTRACLADRDCRQNTLATVCVSSQCAIPCVDEAGEPDLSLCGLGEVCKPGDSSAGPTHYCDPVDFEMDLNLLDACVTHFVDGLVPNLQTQNVCSMEARLALMLDQTGDGSFNIYDVDQCVRTYLQQVPCTEGTNDLPGTCPGGDIWCADDSRCGRGSYCSTVLRRCVRECGYIANREFSGPEVLDRQCASALTWCNYERGQCEVVYEPGDACDGDAACAHGECIEGECRLLCQVDGDCPAGAYCYLGLCAANCFRSSDCPSSDWYCDSRNRCQVRPVEAPPGGFSFDPQRYVVRFAFDEISLSPIETTSDAPVVIMDIETGLQVFDNPAVGFGYRLELGDVTKLDQRCGDNLAAQLAGLDEVEDEEERNAIIRLREECRPSQFFRLQSPYGTVNAVTSNAIGVEVDETLAQGLTPGMYTATLQAFFDNGDATSTRVVYIAPGPSGDYIGQLRVYMGEPENELGTTTFATQLYVDSDSDTCWHDLLVSEGLAAPSEDCQPGSEDPACVALFEEDVIDYTRGYEVYGTIDGNQTLVFNWPDAQKKDDNRIPVRGIYVPSQQHMRLVGLIDVGEGDCRSDEGSCLGDSEQAFKVRNPFARNVRRLFFFYGPFEHATSRFHGFYRETITGLAPYPVTVSGTFGLTQVTPRNDPIELEAALVPSGQPGVAQFPTNLEKEVVDADLARYCTPCELTTLGFEVLDAPDRDYWLDVDKLLASICPDADGDGYCDLLEHEEPAAECSSDPNENTRRLRDVHQFSEALALALDALEASEGGAERALSIYDFLRGQIRFCDELTPDERQDGMVCVDKGAAQCGLAMFRKALLFDRENLGSLAPGCSDAEQNEGIPCENPGYTLFCRRDLGPGCNYPPAENQLLFVLQRHAAYYRELVQALKYEAGALQTDAFFTLYRNGIGDIEREEALTYKQLKLLEAWNTYEELRSYFFAPVATQVMIEWPMTAFAGLGQGWLDLMHNTAADRLALMMDVVDLKRRLLMTANETDYMFAQDLMHYEYLSQVLVMEVQRRWQQPLGQFRYEGEGPEAFKAGDNILARLNLERNPLGLHPDQVYFESSDPTLSNWRNYKRVISNGPPGSGLLPDVEYAVQVAVENLRASLQETRTLQEMIEDAKMSYEDAVDSLCGPTVDAGGTGDEVTPLCEPLSPEEREAARLCIGEGCPSEIRCADAECTTVAQVLNPDENADDADGQPDVLANAACRLHTQNIVIDDGGTARTCLRGQVGSLLQERETLRLQREQIKRKMNVLRRQMVSQADYISFLGDEHDDLKEVLDHYRDWAEGLALAADAATLVAETSLAPAHAAENCWVIAGFSVGTGCPGAIAANIVRVAALLAKWAALPAIRIKQRYDAYQQQIYELDARHRDIIKQQHMALDNLSLGAISLLNEYEQVTQLIFNLNVRINDTVYLAEQSAKHYHTRVDRAVDRMEDHLSGAAVGNVLVRNAYVTRANERFHGLLIATYKMAAAFIHSYNLEDDRNAILNQVFRLTTPDDVRELVRDLEVREVEYCGASGIDCDAENNAGYLRVSLRDLKFPQFVDITGASGEVLTRGQQFHDAITGPQYLRTRERGGWIVRQIEIPFEVTLEDRVALNDPEERWMISPLECNHIIVGRGGGTFAVNVLGSRLQNLKYELWRGPTDRIRACDPVERVNIDGYLVREYPINSHTVGYAPQSANAALDNPPEFQTHTSALLACKNEPERGGNYVTEERCYNYYARDRSLASPELTLVIPVGAGFGNEWIVDDEVEDPAVIEDIVLYFRYRTRPL